MTTEEPARYPSIGWRVLAFGLDLAILAPVTVAVFVAINVFLGRPIEIEWRLWLTQGYPIVETVYVERHLGELMSLWAVVQIVIVVAYMAGLESSAVQATVGKALFGLKVTDISGRRVGVSRAVVRAMVKGPWPSLHLMGYVLVFFTKRRQALHDLMAGTMVVARQVPHTDDAGQADPPEHAPPS